MSNRETLLARAAELKIDLPEKLTNKIIAAAIAAAEAALTKNTPAQTITPDAQSGASGEASGPTGDTNAAGSGSSSPQTGDGTANGLPSPPLDPQAEIEDEQFAAAAEGHSVIVTGPKRGRWRGGRYFTPEATAIPMAELSLAEMTALDADPRLTMEVVKTDAVALAV